MFIAICIFSIFAPLFFSCTNEPIFAAIEEEIALSKFSVKNYVYSVVRFKDCLYAAHNTISRKPATSRGAWDDIGTPDGEKILELAVGDDGASMFAFTMSYSIYCFDGENWRRLEFPEWTDDMNLVAILGNGVRAYATFLCVGDQSRSGCYELSAGEILPEKVEGTTADTIKCAGTADNMKFASHLNLCYSESLGRFYGEDESEVTSRVSTSRSAEYYETDKAKWLACASSNAGVYMIALDENGDVTEKVFANKLANASTTVGVYTSFRLWVFGDAIFDATYSASDSEQNGLWAYYDSRGTWDRE